MHDIHPPLFGSSGQQATWVNPGKARQPVAVSLCQHRAVCTCSIPLTSACEPRGKPSRGATTSAEFRVEMPPLTRLALFHAIPKAPRGLRATRLHPRGFHASTRAGASRQNCPRLGRGNMSE